MKKLGIVLSIALLATSSSAVAADLVDLYDEVAPSPPLVATETPLEVDLAGEVFATETGDCDECESGYDRYESDSSKLFGLFVPSERRFNDFISPMTNPVYFEDPRTLTEARMIFLNHRLPSSLGKGNVQLYATQLRAALTDRRDILENRITADLIFRY